MLLSYPGIDGYSEADGYGNSKIWIHIYIVRKGAVFIECEAKVTSRVSGVKCCGFWQAVY